MESRQMKSKRLLQPRCITYILATLTIVLGLALSGASASAATVVVGNCTSATGVPNIVEGVALANPGDTVEVCPGTYPEQVPIIENITLTNVPGKANPVITYPATPQCFYQPDIVYPYCPEIYVYAANPTIQRLTFDGSNFSLSGINNPTGILFQDSSGTVRDSKFINLASGEGNAYGVAVLAYPTVQGGNTVNVTGNTISNFGSFAIGLFGLIQPSETVVDQTGTISGNTITIAPDNKSLTAIYTYFTTGVTIAGNTITAPSESKLQSGALFDVADQDLTVSINTISKICEGIELDDPTSATVNFNTLDNVCSVGILALCTKESSIGFNTITGLPGKPPTATAGVKLEACGEDPADPSENNTIVLNTIKNFCAGILTGPAIDTDNNIVFNLFANITPGMDIMSGDVCPPAAE